MFVRGFELSFGFGWGLLKWKLWYLDSLPLFLRFAGLFGYGKYVIKLVVLCISIVEWNVKLNFPSWFDLTCSDFWWWRKDGVVVDFCVECQGEGLLYVDFDKVKEWKKLIYEAMDNFYH